MFSSQIPKWQLYRRVEGIQIKSGRNTLGEFFYLSKVFECVQHNTGINKITLWDTEE